MPARTWSGRKRWFTAGGNEAHVATSLDSLVAPYKPKHTLSIQLDNRTPWYLPKVNENVCPYKTLHMNVYSNFTPNCQHLEAAKMSFSRRMDKLMSIHPKEYYSVLERNELPSYEKEHQTHITK